MNTETINKKKPRKVGSGRFLKYGEKTTTIAFRVPISKVMEMKLFIDVQVKRYEKNKYKKKKRNETV